MTLSTSDLALLATGTKDKGNPWDANKNSLNIAKRKDKAVDNRERVLGRSKDEVHETGNPLCIVSKRRTK